MNISNEPFHIIPSVRELKNLSYALSLDLKYIYLSDVHIAGLNTDSVGIKLLKQLFKVDIVIGRGFSKINMAKSAGLNTIQRIILEDTIALDTSLKLLNQSKSDMIELRPGLYGLKFLEEYKKERNTPYILSGFVDSKAILQEAKKLGFSAITTSSKDLWNFK
uniref:Glycerol-3-phosphate responsive antiterminator n=1 Tax=Batrachochytrium dendrobatidis (strain JAM81 / FGSC 10211) TaxID=684364 RepID=F4PFI7_BATDJ|eukprot:XP_006683368.1 hypothetical protein BATDEDRAFT_93132 [Batrachochytrium dendrobatidis JAM81]